MTSQIVYRSITLVIACNVCNERLTPGEDLKNLVPVYLTMLSQPEEGEKCSITSPLVCVMALFMLCNKSNTVNDDLVCGYPRKQIHQNVVRVSIVHA